MSLQGSRTLTHCGPSPCGHTGPLPPSHCPELPNEESYLIQWAAFRNFGCRCTYDHSALLSLTPALLKRTYPEAGAKKVQFRNDLSHFLDAYLWELISEN